MRIVFMFLAFVVLLGAVKVLSQLILRMSWLA